VIGRSQALAGHHPLINLRRCRAPFNCICVSTIYKKVVGSLDLDRGVLKRTMWLIFPALAVMMTKRAMRPPPTCGLADHRPRPHHGRNGALSASAPGAQLGASVLWIFRRPVATETRPPPIRGS